MKKIICIIMLIVFATIFTGCGSSKNICAYDVKQNKEICKTYTQKGIVNGDERSKKVEYSVVWGNVILGIVFFERMFSRPVPKIFGG